MPLPEGFYEHLSAAEEGLKRLKDQIANGSLGSEGVVARSQVVQLDLECATVILKQVEGEAREHERDARNSAHRL